MFSKNALVWDCWWEKERKKEKKENKKNKKKKSEPGKSTYIESQREGTVVVRVRVECVIRFEELPSAEGDDVGKKKKKNSKEKKKI